MTMLHIPTVSPLEIKARRILKAEVEAAVGEPLTGDAFVEALRHDFAHKYTATLRSLERPSVSDLCTFFGTDARLSDLVGTGNVRL